MAKPIMILESNLTSEPRYYATRAYRMTKVINEQDHTARMLVRVTGHKDDVTDQIEAIIARRMKTK